jgi:hypothetical protein
MADQFPGNQFGGFGQIPGQSQQPRQPRFGGGGQPGFPRQKPGAPGMPPRSGYQAGNASGSHQPGTAPQTYASMNPQPAASSATPPAAGAAGQTPPASTTPSTAPAPAAQPAPQAQQQPTYHAELGNFGDAGAWTNGYNPHMVQDPAAPRPAAPTTQYPAGTFPSMAPTSAPAATPAAPAQAPMQWANNQSPQQFLQDNPYYGQTGYYGGLEQVQQQVAGHAQAAGKPLGVLDSSFYTQSPAGQPAWQPAPTAAETNAKDAQWQQYVDSAGRFADPGELDKQFAAWKSTGQLPGGGQYPSGTFR